MLCDELILLDSIMIYGDDDDEVVSVFLIKGYKLTKIAFFIENDIKVSYIIIGNNFHLCKITHTMFTTYG
jgi:hypothetical protein